MAASIWPLEVVNGLLTAERRGRLSLPDSAESGRLLLALPIVVDPVSRSRACDPIRTLARTHGLSSYDAAYLEVAVRLGVPLATLHGDLEAAAEAQGIGRIRQVAGGPARLRRRARRQARELFLGIAADRH